MERRDYSLLNKQIAVFDIHDDADEPDVLCGIAIRSSDLSNFLDDLTDLAVKKYGGATFEELLDNDLDDASATATTIQSNKEMFENVVIAAENIMRNADKQEE